MCFGMVSSRVHVRNPPATSPVRIMLNEIQCRFYSLLPQDPLEPLGIRLLSGYLVVIRRAVSSTYAGLYVDEYQDCSDLQHSLVHPRGLPALSSAR